MTLTKQDVLYGLRNLVTGDDEQTRIADLPIEDVGLKVFLMANNRYAPDFDGAYRLAIREAAFDESHPEGDWDIVLWDCLKWSWDFNYPYIKDDGLIPAIRFIWNEAQCMYALWNAIIETD